MTVCQVRTVRVPVQVEMDMSPATVEPHSVCENS